MLVALPVNNLIHYISNTCETFRDLLKRQGWRIWLKFKIKRRSCVKRAHPLNKASIIYLWFFSIHGPLAYPHKYRRFILHYFIIYHFSFNPSIFPSKTTGQRREMVSHRQSACGIVWSFFRLTYRESCS